MNKKQMMKEFFAINGENVVSVLAYVRMVIKAKHDVDVTSGKPGELHEEWRVLAELMETEPTPEEWLESCFQGLIDSMAQLDSDPEPTRKRKPKGFG